MRVAAGRRLLVLGALFVLAAAAMAAPQRVDGG